MHEIAQKNIDRWQNFIAGLLLLMGIVCLNTAFISGNTIDVQVEELEIENCTWVAPYEPDDMPDSVSVDPERFYT